MYLLHDDSVFLYTQIKKDRINRQTLTDIRSFSFS